MNEKAATAQAEHPEAADTAQQQPEATQPDADATDQVEEQAAEQQAQAEHPEAARVRELLTRNGLPKAWILPGGHLCFDATHAKAVAGADFEALPTITAG